MIISFTQRKTELEMDDATSLIQFSRNTPVSVRLSDNTYLSNADIPHPNYRYILTWQDKNRINVAKTDLEYDEEAELYYGKIGKAATIFSGLTYVALAAIDTDSGITLTTHSAEVYILRSIDPESAFIEDPASLSDVIDGAVDAWLTANGTSLSHRLLRLENDTIYANVAINATVKKGYKWTYLAGDNVTVTADADYNAISFLTSDDDSEYVRAKITGTGIGTSEIQTIYYMDSDSNVLDTISDYAFDDGMIEFVVPDRTAEIRFTALADDNPIVTGAKHALSNTVNEIQEEINRLSDGKVNLNYGENHAAQFLVTNAIGSVAARALEAVVDGKVIRVRSPQEYADGSHDKYLEIDLSGVIPEAGATAEQAAQIEKNTADISQLSEEIANLGSGSGASSLHITIDSDNIVHFTTSSTDTGGTGDTDGGGSSDSGSTGGDSDVGVDGGVILHCTDGSVISCGNALDELQYRYVFLISDTYYVYASTSPIEILRQFSADGQFIGYVIAYKNVDIYRGKATDGALGTDFAVLEPSAATYYGGYRTTEQLVYANVDIYTTAGVLWASATV